MARFKDNNGREWSIALDAPTIRTVRKELDGLDLADSEGKTYQQIADDPLLLFDVLWLLCCDQAQAAGIDEHAFAPAIVGDACARATLALRDAIADFFPPQKRELLKAIENKGARLRELGMAKALEKLNDPALEERALAEMERQMDEELRKALIQSPSATTSPGSAESAPEA